MKLKKVLDKNAAAAKNLNLTQVLKKSPDRQIEAVRRSDFWAGLSTTVRTDEFWAEFARLSPAAQTNALLNPQMWQTLDPRLIPNTGGSAKGEPLTDKTKQHIEAVLKRQSNETLNYIFLMPSFLQMLPLNNFHSDYIIGLKLNKLVNNVAGTPRDKKIFALLFETVLKMPQGRKVLEEGITCFQTHYLFDTAARYCAHWQTNLKLCSLSKTNSPLDEIENNPAMRQYAAEHLLHELYHMGQFDAGCRQNTGASLFEKFVAYRLLELETAVLNALPHNGPSISYQDTPSKKRPLYFMKKYMSWLTEQNGGDEQKAKTAFAKHLWAGRPNAAFESAAEIRKIFTSWNKQYNLSALNALSKPFNADVRKCAARLKTHVGTNIPPAYFLDAKNMSLNIETPAFAHLQGQIFNTLQTIQNAQKDADVPDRFLMAALSMEKAPQMVSNSYRNKMFDYCMDKYEETQKKMYLKGILHILSAENFQDPQKLAKVKNISPLQKHLDSMRAQRARPFGLRPARDR